jgi:hypothetical protein
MRQTLTLDAIKTKYSSEWVLIEDPEVDQHLRIIRGRVVWHSKDRDEVYQKMLELKPKSPATVFTGGIPEGTAVVL